MKKIGIILILSLMTLSADMLSIKAGVGIQEQKISGYVKSGDTINYFNNSAVEKDGNIHTGNLGLDNKNNPYFWIKIIHPIFFIPDIKFQYTRYYSTGHSNYIAGNIKILDKVNIPNALIDANTKMDINSYDITAFYEFNPVFADMELGAGADIWRGKTTISGEESVTHINKTWINDSWSVVLPYLYGHIETMKLYGVSAIASVKWAKAGDDHHYDYVGALKYTIDIPGPINPFIKFGYRYKEVYGVDGDNITKLKYKGYFAEIGAKF